MCVTCEMIKAIDWHLTEGLTLDKYKWFAFERALFGETTWEETAQRLLREAAPDALLSIVDIAINDDDPALRKEAQDYLSNLIDRRNRTMMTEGEDNEEL